MFEGRVEAMPRQATLDRNTLEMALIGYEAERARIQAVIADVQARLRGNAETAESAPKKRTMSAAARARIGEAQRKRWAAQRHATEAPERPKRKMSAAGRRAIRRGYQEEMGRVPQGSGRGGEGEGREARAKDSCSASSRGRLIMSTKVRASSAAHRP